MAPMLAVNSTNRYRTTRPPWRAKSSAWIAEHNSPSRRVAARLGLENYGLAINPADGQRLLAYSDRPIGAFHG